MSDGLIPSSSVPPAVEDARIPAGYTIRMGIAGTEPAGWLVIRDNGALLMNGGRVFETSDDATRFIVDHLASIESW